jgi:hypothetical protein
MPYVDISELDYQRLTELVQAAAPEDRFLEYKRELGSTKEMAKDVCAFANSEGGLILYGVAEGQGRRLELLGIDPKGAVEAVDNVLASALSPRVNALTKLVLLPGTDRAVLAVSIPESNLKPHMVSAYEDRRYYARRNATNVPMDEIEIQEAYRTRTKAESEAEAFADKVIKSRYAVRYPEHAWASLICVPRLVRDGLIPIEKDMQQWLSLWSARRAGLFNGYPRVSPEGFTIFEETEKIPRYSHAVIGREGHVEAVIVLDPYAGKNTLPTWTLTEVTLQFLEFCGLLYEKVAYYGIVKLFLSADGVGKMTLGWDPIRSLIMGPGMLQADRVYISREEAAVSLRAEQLRICKLFMDRVYQAAGIMACDYFQDGKLVPPAR